MCYGGAIMGKHMTKRERLQLEALLKAKVPVAKIAEQLGFTRQTIYNEIKRGEYMHDTGYTYVRRYSADKAQQITSYRQTAKGQHLKIDHDHALANFLEEKIVKEHFSPEAALAAAKAAGFTTTICRNTLYSYIEKGVFRTLSNKHLHIKGHRREKKEKPEPRTPHPKLPSIEKRPEKINDRTEYGHWEMDLIVSAKGGRAVLLTLMERKTREMMIFKLPNRKAATIKAVFDKLETKSEFRRKFKSITTDNGSEFLQYDELCRSIHGGQRFTVWYCHSYAAWEKGAVENGNRMIRRFFPKGTDFTKVTTQQITEVQNWMNNYPRRILNWQTPKEAAKVA